MRISLAMNVLRISESLGTRNELRLTQLKIETKRRTQMNPILEINEPDFELEVLKYTLPVLVSFWAPWSQPCGRIGPVLDEVAARCNGTARVVKVNVDDNPDLGLRFAIQSIPTLLYFFHGKVSAKIIGTASKEAILAKLHSLRPQPVPETANHIQA
jgi:thioredoxin 1